MKKFLKIAAVVLAIAAVFAAFALSIGASVGNVGYASYTDADGVVKEDLLVTALAGAKDGTTVKLLGNCQLEVGVTVNKDLKLDLNGYTLTSAVADTFTINTTGVDFEILGTGSMVIGGRLLNSSSMTNGEYTFKVTGSENSIGIDINHSGAAAKSIVYAGCGTHTFTRVNVVSTASNAGIYDAAFRGTLANETTATYDDTRNGNANNLEFYFNTFYYRNASIAAGQNKNTFIMPTGLGSYVSIKDSAIYNGGTLLNFGYTTEDSIEDVLCDVEDSILQIVSTDSKYRSCLIWAQKCDGSDVNKSQTSVARVHYGTVKLTDSFIGGPCYRGIHGVTDSTDKFKVVLDNSTIANTGANDNDATGDNKDHDVMLTRGVLLYAKNNSAIITCGTGNLAANSGAVKIESSTRFADYNIANGALGGKATIVDSTGTAVAEGTAKLVLDPITDVNLPYVITTDSTKISYTAGASAVRMYGLEGVRGWGSKSAYGYKVGGVGTIKSYSFDAQIDPKGTGCGAFTQFTYGTNSGIKWLINPTSDVPNNGDKRTVGEGYMVLGGGSKYDNSIAKISNTKVAVFDFDIASDSEYGFSAFQFKPQSRNSSDADTATSDVYAYINNDGSITNSALKNFDSTIRLSRDEWNHVTVVVYSDTTVSGTLGQAFVYVNGKLLGYSDSVFKTGTEPAYIQGVRFNIRQNFDQVVGSSTIFDNVLVRSYDSYLAIGEADGAAKNPEAYLINDDLKNTSPVNDKITAAGKSYGTLAEAITAANSLKTFAKVNGEVTAPQTVATNGTVYGAHSVNIAPDSYGFVKNSEGYVFSEDYNYTALWFNGDYNNPADVADESKYIAENIKLGFEVNHDFFHTEGTADYERFQMVTQSGWAYELNASEGFETFVPGLAELNEANANGGKVKFYPVISGVDMTYYVKSADGTVNRGGVTNVAATADIKALANGDTFVLRSDVVIEDSCILYSEKGTLNIDLAGNTLAKSQAGVFFQVGNNTTLNVYSSVAGGVVIADYTEAGAANNGTAFAISDGTNNSVKFTADSDHKTLLNSTTDGETTTYSVRPLNNAVINVGKFGDIPGSNMTIVAATAYMGYLGTESCAINSDGVNLISAFANTNAGPFIVETYVYDGAVNVKNCVVFAPLSNAVVNAVGFSQDGKNTDATHTYPRFAGFENLTIKAHIAFDNVYIVNKLSGLSDGSNNNVIANNGDAFNPTVRFHNVVATGRLNPSNATRNIMDGFVAVETHGCSGSNPTSGTITAIYGAPMTWQILDLGIESEYLTFAIPMYDIETGEFSTYANYNIANNGADVSGLTNVYVLPMLDATANVYESDAVTVEWVDIDESVVKTENYVKGGIYKTITAPTANATVELEVLTLGATGAWSGIPAAGTVLNENITVNAEYEVTGVKVSGIKTNLSIYSDFGVNLLIPKQYDEYVSVSFDGEALEKSYSTVGGVDYLVVTVRRDVKDVDVSVAFDVTVTEGTTSVSKTANVNIVDYANTILTDTEDKYTVSEKELMYYMVAYSNEAVKYFTGTENERLAAIVANEDYKANLAKYDVSEYEYVITNTGLGAAFKYASVQLTSAPNFLFVLKDKLVQDNFKGTLEVTYGSNTKVIEIDATKSEYVLVKDMRVYNFASLLDVTVKDLDGNVVATGNYNLDTFVNYHVNNAADATSPTQAQSEACLPLVTAFYNYVYVANQYKAGTLAN